VDASEDRRPLGQVEVAERGQLGDDLVDAGITGGGQSKPLPFGIHSAFLPSCSLVTTLVVLVRYPPA
jgi:hypothetical protein